MEITHRVIFMMCVRLVPQSHITQTQDILDALSCSLLGRRGVVNVIVHMLAMLMFVTAHGLVILFQVSAEK